MSYVIAIDGPAGAGKSTLARLLAKKLSYRYIDTGAMYRAITWLALEKGIEVDDQISLTKLAENIDIKFHPGEAELVNKITVNGQDVTKLIREPRINNNVSYVARIKGVRDAMLILQRKMAEEGGVIMDGRDIASRVLPHADLKFYITASIEERAARRYKELAPTAELSLEEVKAEINRRDHIDANRKEAPLIKTDDAILIDTTNLSIEQALDRIMKIIKGG